MATEVSSHARTPSSVRAIPWIGLTLLLLALLAAVPLWTGPGIVNTRGGGDSPFLFFRLHQLMVNLREGVFPARWMPDAAYGLGYPFFNYYASLPYYLAALFNFIGFDLLVSIKIVQTLGFVFAAFAMYGWARRRFTTRSASWLVAVAYLYAPFHLVNIYVRGDSLGEFCAFIFYPLILWSIDRILDAPRNFPLLALSYGGLILTHNVSALIFSPFVALYVIVSLTRSIPYNQKSAILSLAFGLLLAFALSAFFWLPALGEANLAQLDVQTTGYFNYAQHFRSANLVQNSIGFDYAIAATPESTTPFAMGLLQALATGAGVIAMLVTWRRATQRVFRIFVLLGLIVSTVMITPLSKILWDNLPLLPLTQFPWRFLSIQSLFAAWAIGCIGQIRTAKSTDASRTERGQDQLRMLCGGIGLALVASMLFTLHPDYLPIRADEITPDRLQLYEAFTSNIGTTIRAEYLPRTMIPRPYTGPALIDRTAPPHPIVSAGEAAGAQTERHATWQRWQIDVASESAVLDFPLTEWPGWRAFVDGREVETRSAPDLGYLQIDAPHGEHRVELRLSNTPIRTVAEIISALTLALLLIMTGRQISANQRLSGYVIASPAAASVYLVLVGVLGLAALVILHQTAYAVPANPNDLTMDFVDRPWLHHNPSAVNFGAAQLRFYQLQQHSADITFSGEWEVTADANVTGTVALVAPSTHLFDGPAPLVEQIISITGGANRVDLTPPFQPATGMYYVRVQIGDRVEYLSPVWIIDTAQPSSSHVFGKLTPAIGLEAVQTQLRDPNRLDVLLQWASTGVMDANDGISLRLRDSSGRQWIVTDTQPGYGFQPASAWQVGTWSDGYVLNLPADLPRDRSYSLDVILYHVASQQEVGRATIDNLKVDQLHVWQPVEPPARSFTAPHMSQSLNTLFGQQIELVGYDLKHEGGALKIDLAWKALRDIDANYKVFVHVFDPATEKVVAQWDAMPRNNAYPTSRWVTGEIVTETLTISLSGIRPGSYRLAIGLYDPLTSDRLPVKGSQEVDAANQRVILPEKITK